MAAKKKKKKQKNFTVDAKKIIGEVKVRPERDRQRVYYYGSTSNRDALQGFCKKKLGMRGYSPVVDELIRNFLDQVGWLPRQPSK